MSEINYVDLVSEEEDSIPPLCIELASPPRRQYYCQICDKTFKRGNKFITHTDMHYGYKRFQCDVCQKKFRYKNTMKRHRDLHSDELTFECQICLTTFKKRTLLKKHHKKIHAHPQQPSDSVISAHPQQPTDSVISAHSQQPSDSVIPKQPYKCDFCQKAFSVESEMKDHRNIHTKERTFKCNICEWTFSKLKNLNKHLKLFHTKEIFIASDQSKNDMDTSNVETFPHVCYVCFEKFTKNDSLVIHLYNHYGMTLPTNM